MNIKKIIIIKKKIKIIYNLKNLFVIINNNNKKKKISLFKPKWAKIFSQQFN